MSDAIRRGTIIIDLISGKVEMPQPKMGGVLVERQKEIDLVNALETAIKNAWAAQDKLRETTEQTERARGAGGGGKGQSDHLAEQNRHLNEAVKNYSKVADGVFRLTRAAVLLGSSSDESFKKMIQGLAMVQGGFDLFKGTQQIVQALEKAQTALAKATAAAAAAQALETSAQVAGAAASAALTAKTVALIAAKKVLAAVTNPVVLAITFLVGVIGTAVSAYDKLTISAEEQKKINDEVTASVERHIAALERQADRQDEIAKLRQSTMTDAQRAASLFGRRADIGNIEQGSQDAQHTSGPGQKAALEFNSRLARRNAADLQEAKQLKAQILQEEIKSRDEQIRAIQNQQQLVRDAQKHLDIEKEKVRQFSAQAAGLSDLEKQQLRGFRDRLRGGGNLTRAEEDQFARIGGEQAEGIVTFRRAKRGAAEGFDENFFKGIEGASTGLKDASDALDEVVAALKKLVGESTAPAKIAELERQKAALTKSFEDFAKLYNKEINRLINVLEANGEKIRQLEQAALRNAQA